MKRTVIGIAWDNGGNYTNQTNGFLIWGPGPSLDNPSPSGNDDTSHSYQKYLDSTNGLMFDLDAPGCSAVLLNTNIFLTSEAYDNFYEYVTVNFGNGAQVCSFTNTWSYESRVDDDGLTTNRVPLNSLSTSLISLPSTPYYSKH